MECESHSNFLMKESVLKVILALQPGVTRSIISSNSHKSPETEAATPDTQRAAIMERAQPRNLVGLDSNDLLLCYFAATFYQLQSRVEVAVVGSQFVQLEN